MEDTEGIWPWKMNQEATDFAREEELWQGQEVSGVMWVLLNFSYFGAPTPSPKELYTELVDGLRGSNPCTSSGSEPNQKMFHPLLPSLGPCVYPGAVERATSFIKDDLWYGIFVRNNPGKMWNSSKGFSQ
ncbi:hypothetical protein SAY87_003440 [Trapa incisa]|uniref:Nal1 C-terminal domain-containing protein n=1 Tax=Trapa incisa TaxID=236973 RepID=A0AAN7KNR0_9MYRT|nr:hypothetical protein SAY87_003440 [Trapa incisa]